MTGESYLKDVRERLQAYRAKAEKAMAQVDDAEFFAELNANTNPIAVIVKHLAGNFRSRWRDFLTSDGEKPDRDRDTEFALTPEDSRERLMQRWSEAWTILEDTLDHLQPEDLDRTVLIRNEPHSVVAAINRSLLHAAEHIGQIILLARHYTGDSWTTLSIPKGKTRDFNREKGLNH